MAFSWAPPGRAGEAACNEAPYLVAEGRIRRVTRGQLGRNNESFLFLFVSVSNPVPLLLLPVRTAAHQVTFSVFFFLAECRGGRSPARGSTALWVFNKQATHAVITNI